MIADLGYIAIFLALATSVYSATAFVLGATRQQPALVQSARNGTYAVFGLVSIASFALLYALLARDFQLSYVASYTSRATSVVYTIAGFWAGNAGSLLLWSWLLALCGAIVLWQNRRKNQELIPYASLTILVTQALFLALMVFTANPFQKLPAIPADGQGLNPLLENPGMLFHPTTLLAGYAGFTIPFAFAVAALITRRLDHQWLATTRNWTLVFWLLLGIGNVLGMQWAYVELGWGGYWAWDPVENAGLMPWLTATAFLHSLMVQRRGGMLKVWNMSLIGATFFLAIFGTFITRSNILSSVHTFGESGQGPFFLFFITAGIILFTALVVSRLSDLRSEHQMESLLSREASFLLNNLVLVAATVVILLGTMLPLFSRILAGKEVTVGATFFNSVAGPILVVLVLLMGLCPLIGWYRTSPGKLLNNLLTPLYAALATAIVLLTLALVRVIPLKPYAVATFSICAFALTTVFLEWGRGTRARHRIHGENYFRAFISLIGKSRARYGGYFVHIGIVLIAMGIGASSAYSISEEFTLAPGGSMKVGQYTLRYEGLDQYPTPKQMVVSAGLSVTNGQRAAGHMEAKRYFKSNFNPVSEIGLRSGVSEDLYIILMGWDESGSAAFKVLVNPLVLWIWVGGGLMLGGTFIALWPTQRRNAEE
ncbi:MAG: heme lyase CcmF/NrfE family subunit [Chloroflexota bacterium]